MKEEKRTHNSKDGGSLSMLNPGDLMNSLIRRVLWPVPWAN